MSRSFLPKDEIFKEAFKIYEESGRSSMRKYVNSIVDWHTALGYCREIEGALDGKCASCNCYNTNYCMEHQKRVYIKDCCKYYFKNPRL